MAAGSECSLVVGVDVGGTNTDAVVLEGRRVLSQWKCLTTPDVTTGVIRAVQSAISALDQGEQSAGGTSVAERVSRVNIGTTHFVNAVVQRRRLARVAVIRLCGSSTHALPPFTNFPAELKECLCASVHLVKGGFEFSGAEIDAVDADELRRCFASIQSSGVSNIVLCGVFSPACNSHELQAAEILKEVYPSASCTLSHQVAQLGLLERENAAILNEALKPLSRTTVAAFQEALAGLHLSCPFFLTQNDGTLISSNRTVEFPILTFSSGPTNSMRGAMWLSGMKNALVVDVGGTSTDIGTLKNGFPREASTQREVGGVATNFRLPDVVSVGLGGGSVVSVQEDHKTGAVKVSVGPQSVANELFTRGKSFGGDTLTTTDVAMVAGVCPPLPSATPPQLEPRVVYAVMQEVHRKLEMLVDAAKTDQGDVPVLLVGGGSALIDCSRSLRGASQVIRPQHFDVANAVGAALGQVSGSVERIVTLDNDNRDASLKSARQQCEEEARLIAVAAGAEPRSVKVVDVSNVEVPYVGKSGMTKRMRVTVVGDLFSCRQPMANEGEMQANEEVSEMEEGETAVGDSPNWPYPSAAVKELDDKAGLSEPTVDASTGEWLLTEQDLECLAIGAGIMGCGGGGSPTVGHLLALRALKDGQKIRIVNPFRCAAEVKGYSVAVAFMGAPTILVEKLINGGEAGTALHAMRQLIASGVCEPENGDGQADHGVVRVTADADAKNNVWRADGYQSVDISAAPPHRQVTSLVSAEIGGCNSIEPLILGAALGLPVLDVDGMGRAFPELQMYLPFMLGSPPYPACVADNKGEVVAITHCDSAKALEDVFRAEVMRMGLAAAISLGRIHHSDVLSKCVLLSMSRAWGLGRAVLRARQEQRTPHEAVVESQNGRLLMTGKIVSVLRATEGGFSTGHLVVEGRERFAGKYLHVAFQNENLVARTTDSPVVDKEGKPHEGDVTTPDLICIMDIDSGYPVTTEDLQYGQRVSVVAIAADEKMKTPTALKVVGPRAFGFKFDYLPLKN